MTFHFFWRFSRGARHARGATLVEFALVAPLLFLFVFGLFEFGRYVMVQQALTNAAREGSRNASLAVTRNAESVEAAVRDGLRGVISARGDANPVSITVTPSDLSHVGSGAPVEVSVSVDASEVSWLPVGLSHVVGRLASTSVHSRE